MSAAPRIVVLATLVALVAVVAAGIASADPKNQYPFTRPVGTRVLGVDVVRAVAYPDLAPTPEAKNELPFTKQMDTTAAAVGTPTRRGAGAVFAAGGGSPGGLDWALVGWGLAAVLTVAGGSAVALAHARLSGHVR